MECRIHGEATIKISTPIPTECCLFQLNVKNNSNHLITISEFLIPISSVVILLPTTSTTLFSKDEEENINLMSLNIKGAKDERQRERRRGADNDDMIYMLGSPTMMMMFMKRLVFSTHFECLCRM